MILPVLNETLMVPLVNETGWCYLPRNFTTVLTLYITCPKLGLISPLVR